MRVLIIAAHPDDEVLGVGGTIARHVDKGDEVFILMVTEGSSTQYKNQAGKIQQKKLELEKVKETLGITEVIYLDLPDMKLDTIPKADLNEQVAKAALNIKPEIVYTHFYGDINNDHQVVFEATMVAVRPIGDYSVRRVLAYNTPSSTEWSAQTSNNVFLPNVYVDITDYLPKKIEAMKQYQSELRSYPHPRSLESLNQVAKFWGKHIGVDAAEPFMLIREIEKGEV